MVRLTLFMLTGADRIDFVLSGLDLGQAQDDAALVDVREGQGSRTDLLEARKRRISS